MLKSDGICPSCESRDIIPSVTVMDRIRYTNDSVPLAVGMYRRPRALFGKGPFQSPLRAWICGNCGYSELYIENPQELKHIYKQTKGGTE